MGRGVEIITRDANGLIALAKPAGVLSHPNTREDESRSLLHAPYVMEGEFYEWKPAPDKAPVRLWLLNRLDSATSGVILAADTAKLADEIRAQFKKKQVRKVYCALVFGRPQGPTQAWRDLLAVEKKAGLIRTRATAGHIPAESKMTVLKTEAGPPALALIKLEPTTGRSHQLRVQCAKRHLPIVGDATYGDFGKNREFAKQTRFKRLFLHSMETSFAYVYEGREVRFKAEAPLPAEFSAHRPAINAVDKKRG